LGKFVGVYAEVHQAFALPLIDWIVVWKIYGYSFVFWTYSCTNFTIKFLVTKPFRSTSRRKTLLLLIPLSLFIAAVAPFLAMPAFVVELFAGERSGYSLLMTIPIAACVSIGATVLDVAALRTVLRQPVARRKKIVLFATNLVIASLVLSVALARVFLHPVEQLADSIPFVVRT
jgi:hypothetical protein